MEKRIDNIVEAAYSFMDISCEDVACNGYVSAL